MNCRLSPDLANYSLRQRLGQLSSSWLLGPADAPYLARHVQIQTYSPGETILLSGGDVGCLGLIVQGEVAVLAGTGKMPVRAPPLGRARPSVRRRFSVTSLAAKRCRRSPTARSGLCAEAMFRHLPVGDPES